MNGTSDGVRVREREDRKKERKKEGRKREKTAFEDSVFARVR